MDFKECVTWEEILHQPTAWKEALNIMDSHKDKVKSFIENVKKNSRDRVKVIFTGAGSSEFVGNTIASYLNSKTDMEIVSIPTTDIVSMPEQYLKNNVTTILVSFARSGNSPESVAAVELADKNIKNIFHIFITCNSAGKLAEMSVDKENKMLILMPERTNDRGFAMTSSFSSMVIAGALIFLEDNLEKNMSDVRNISQFIEKHMNKIIEEAKTISEIPMDRIVYLGNGVIKGLAEEVSLKILELTAGQIASFHNTFLGFRHGPKSIINNDTGIICMMSKDSYTRSYEKDLLKEFFREKGEKRVIVLDLIHDSEIESIVDYYFSFQTEDLKNIEDIFRGVIYLVYGQLISLMKSSKLGITPDNPCPTGEVNRVVQGVTIHQYHG